MTGNFFIDWGVISVSLFNMVTLLWLGLTVILNSDKRRLGIWIASSGMLMSSVFFAIHTALIFNGLNFTESQINILWSSGWALLMLLPMSWYILILWHVGFWDETKNYLQKRQKYWFYTTVILFFTVARFVLFTKTLPTFIEFASLDLSNSVLIQNIPLLIVIYPFYILLCIGLSIDALRFPGTNSRMMGDIARLRARPWLMASSIMLLIVSVMVTSFMLWVVFKSGEYEKYGTYILLYSVVGICDFVIESCIAISVLLLGQAITSYEIFTGKSLPRRGLFRNWLNVIFISAAYSIIVGAGLNSRISPFYYLILTAFLMTFFYALFNWRFYIERERYMSNLRPFIANQNIYGNLLHHSNIEVTDINTSFNGLCKNILETKFAFLIPLGAFAPLIGGNIQYPESDLEVEFEHLNEIINKIDSHEIISIDLDPKYYHNSIMAVPLWSERGITGVLILSKKIDGGLYTQEEIEIARSVCERLIDTKAGSEMAAWLMEFQRKHITETQLLDRQAKRILHDDVLPLLHTSLISLSTLGEQNETVNSVSQSLNDHLIEAHKKISNLLREMPSGSFFEINKLGLIESLKHFLKNELLNSFDDITWLIDENVDEQLKIISPTFTEVIFYAIREAIRNAAKYGRDEQEENDLNLVISVKNEDKIKIIIEDDGIGMKENSRAKGGSGQGLALHSTMMAVIGGYIILESEAKKYTRVTIVLP